MTFLADEFGEDIHARILRSNAATFDEALMEETKPYGTAELFARFQKWLGQKRAAREALKNALKLIAADSTMTPTNKAFMTRIEQEKLDQLKR